LPIPEAEFSIRANPAACAVVHRAKVIDTARRLLAGSFIIVIPPPIGYFTKVSENPT
jgi:hypothetical protein